MISPESDARLLVVQRDTQFCDEVATALSAYHVVTTTSCKHALQLLREEAFDCHVVDSPLTDGSLSQVCSAVRASDPNAGIVVYSESPEVTAAEVLMLGANVLLHRPRDGAALAHTVSGLLQLQTLRILSARRAEYDAIHEAVLERFDRLMIEAGQARMRNSQWSAACDALLRDNAARLSACRVFLRGGGTRSSFERVWPNLIHELRPPPLTQTPHDDSRRRI